MIPRVSPTRLTPEEVLARVGKVYGVGVKGILSRSHPEAYRCAAWLLRRAANEALQVVAQRFGVSTSRISHIQRAVETDALNRQQTRVMSLCKVK